MTRISRPILIALVVLFSLVWSSAFIAGKIAVDAIDPLSTLALRFCIGSLVMLPFCLARPKRMADRRTLITGSLLGLLNNVVYLGLTFSALRFISPALVVVIASCAPFVTTALSVALRIERFDLVKSFGIVLGFIGVLVIVGDDVTRTDLTGIALATAGMVAFALATVLFRDRASRLPVLHVNFWQSLSAAVVLVPLALVAGDGILLPPMAATLAILYLAVAVTIGAMALWLLLIRASGATTASSYHLLNPFFGVILANLVLGTAVEPRAFLGAAVIAVGLALTMRKRAAAVCEAASH